jgi:hypothetical protein
VPRVWAGPSRAECARRDERICRRLPRAALLGAWPWVRCDRVVDEGLVSDDVDADERLSRKAFVRSDSTSRLRL